METHSDIFIIIFIMGQNWSRLLSKLIIKKHKYPCRIQMQRSCMILWLSLHKNSPMYGKDIYRSNIVSYDNSSFCNVYCHALSYSPLQWRPLPKYNIRTIWSWEFSMRPSQCQSSPPVQWIMLHHRWFLLLQVNLFPWPGLSSRLWINW